MEAVIWALPLGEATRTPYKLLLFFRGKGAGGYEEVWKESQKREVSSSCCTRQE